MTIKQDDDALNRRCFEGTEDRGAQCLFHYMSRIAQITDHPVNWSSVGGYLDSQHGRELQFYCGKKRHD